MSQPGRAREALFKHFGFTGFREGQAEVIDFVLEGHDAVVVMPTGGGKSLCYQLPAMMIDGVTLVVSPLIALMKDQVDQLAARGIPTTFINSSLPYGEMNKRLSEIRLGRHKLVYVAPERFRSDAFGETIRDAKVKLFAVDEAHCISHWGHDFRPDYLRLKAAAEQLGRPQVLALTATATPQVRADISRQLGLLDPQVFVAGFDRPNLALRVLHIGTEKEKIETLKRVIAGSGGTGIVYAATRKSVEQVAARLKMAGLRADPYHGGMGDVERSRTQDSFMRGSSQAIVATNAFGMGIDKPDIRFVVHYHVPGSIEAYYQEVGRAGRDGLPAECLLLFNYADTRTQQFFIEGNHPSPELIGEVYRELAAIGGERIELSAREMAQRLDIKNDMAVNSALLVLEKAGHIERGRAGRSALVVLLTSPIDEALAALPGDTREGEVVRDLIFTWNVTDRESAEVDPGVIATALRSYESHVRRVLGQLSARGIISYRTAYEGRGIRLIDVDARKPPRIDKRELASRAAAEQWKLRKMIDYCYHEKCLRRFILSYFGDRKQIATCGTCSNCATRVAEARQTETTTRRAAAGTLNIGRSAGPATTQQATPLDRFIIEEAPSGEELRTELKKRAELTRATTRISEDRDSKPLRGRPINEAEVIVVKKILSCVARVNNRFGKGTIAAVLRGSSSKQVRDHKLDQLSTYGLLSTMTQDEIAVWIKALIEAGCVAVQKGVYPTVGLTAFGREVMAGRADVLLDL